MACGLVEKIFASGLIKINSHKIFQFDNEISRRSERF